MADRFLLKKFASETNDVGQFGSFQSTGGNIGDGVKTTDPDLIQSLPAWKAGWGNAVDNGLLLPRLEEMNGVQRVFAEMLWNQWRDGVTFWQAGAPVKALQSVVMYQSGDELPKLYINKTGVNGTNPPPPDTDNWTLAFDPTNTQLISNMEQAVSSSTDKYPSSNAVKNYAQSKDVPVVTIPATSGTVALTDNTIYTGAITNAITFSLPTVTDAAIYHQIKLMLTLPVVTINWGTTNYIGGDAPDVSEAGKYMIYFDFVPNLNAWAVGAMIVSVTEESDNANTQ